MNDTEFDQIADILVNTDHGVTAEWIMRQLYHDSRDAHTDIKGVRDATTTPEGSRFVVDTWDGGSYKVTVERIA